MLRTFLIGAGYLFATAAMVFSQEFRSEKETVIQQSSLVVDSRANWVSLDDFATLEFSQATTLTAGNEEVESPTSYWEVSSTTTKVNFQQVIRGQSPGAEGGEGGGAGSGAATDPSAILTQFQIQNVFTPESYNASGYQNTLILQPVLPFPVAIPGLKEIFPAHIMRPTLPIIAPSANPDGPAGVESGLGDLTLLDAYVHNVKGFGTVVAGYTAIMPTATDPQLGRREWQLGPAVGLLYKEIPKTLLGVIYQQPFSLESETQQVLITPILVRHLPDEWYVRWGELNWVFNTDTGGYNIPLNVAVGKVAKFGKQPVNIFVEPFYTPAGLHSGPGGDKWGVKLNVTFLYPEKKFKPLLGCLFDDKQGKSCDSCY